MTGAEWEWWKWALVCGLAAFGASELRLAYRGWLERQRRARARRERVARRGRGGGRQPRRRDGRGS